MRDVYFQYLKKEETQVLLTLKICALTDVHDFDWCSAIINLLTMEPRDIQNLS